MIGFSRHDIGPSLGNIQAVGIWKHLGARGVIISDFFPLPLSKYYFPSQETFLHIGRAFQISRDGNAKMKREKWKQLNDKFFSQASCRFQSIDESGKTQTHHRRGFPFPLKSLGSHQNGKKMDRLLRPHLQEQIKPPLIAQILDPYEVTPDEYAQIKYVLFAHVNVALSLVDMSLKRDPVQLQFWVHYQIQ